MKKPSKKLHALLKGVFDLSVDELMELNYHVVEQIKLLESMQTHKQMMQFEPGCRVSFESKHGRQTGTLMKFNQKTVTIFTDNQQRWNVSPYLLRKEVSSEKTQPQLIVDNKSQK